MCTYSAMTILRSKFERQGKSYTYVYKENRQMKFFARFGQRDFFARLRRENKARGEGLLKLRQRRRRRRKVNLLLSQA